MATPCDIYYQSFKSHLGPPTIEGFLSSNAFKKNSRGKLQKLPYEQFVDLTTDVYDELVRRTEESKKMPFLPPSTCFSPKRNQARQKLGTLSEKRFNDLIGDLFIDLLIRFPDLDTAFRSCIKNFPDRSSRPLPPATPPSPRRSSIFDMTSIMNDVIDKKGMPSYADQSSFMPSFPAGLESVSKKYEAELAVAYRINQDLESRLFKQTGTKSPEITSPILKGNPSLQIDYDLLKDDYNRLRLENEKYKTNLKSAYEQVETLTAEASRLKESLSLYEAEGSLSLASQFAALQRQHAEMKYEYQVEMEELRQRYSNIETAHSRHLTIIESVGKNNEILEIKLRQVNQALELSQQDSANYLRNTGPLTAEPDSSSAFLISDFMIKQLRSSITSLLEIARSVSSSEVVSAVKPLIAQGRHIIQTVEQFEDEAASLDENFRAQVANDKDDFSSALTNILTLTKQQSSSSPHSAYNRFEQESTQLLYSAESLQLLLQTNFCSLPYFSTGTKSTVVGPSKSLDLSRFGIPLHKVSRSFSNPLSLIQKSPTEVTSNNLASMSTPELFRPTSISSDDLMLDPLREYLEEQTETIIVTIDTILGYLRVDDFSPPLVEKVTTVHRKVQQMLIETKQYAAVPHLNDSPGLETVTNGLAVANQTFFCLLEDLKPLANAEGFTTDDVASLEPTLRALKHRLATSAFELARNIKALVQSVS